MEACGLFFSKLAAAADVRFGVMAFVLICTEFDAGVFDALKVFTKFQVKCICTLFPQK